MIPKEILKNIAKKKGLINKEYIEKDYFQDLLLFNIYKKTNLLIFKGGTALYKLYGLQRFSEDLDFSLLRDGDIKKIIEDVVNGIDGAEIKEVKEMKNSLFIKISLKGIITRYNTIRIDITLKNEVLEKFDVIPYISEYIDINPFSMRVLSLKEILAEKIHSLLARQKSRDLYDLFFLLKFVDVDKNLIEKKLNLFGMKYKSTELKRRINKLKTLWEKELKSFILGELPDFNAVRNFVFSKLNIS